MLRFPVLTLTLVTLPALVGAEEMLRWRDAAGGLHYTNVARLAPTDAEAVTATIGRVSLPPLRASRAAAAPAPGPYVQAARTANLPVARGCCGFGGSYTVVLNNPHELADQVKQASLLDALGVPWRKGCCM